MKIESFTPYKAVGKGKFGLVYLSKHISTLKYVAIKYVPMKMILECDCRQRFQQEIDIMQVVDHPFIGTTVLRS